MPGLKKLEIIAYKDKTFSTETGNRFEMMVNPANYDEKKIISYEEEKKTDGGNTPTYRSYKDDIIKIEFFLDNTGAFISWMDYKGPTSKKPLSGILDSLKATVYDYIGDVHEPPFLKIAWGSLNYTGRLKDLTIKYEIFSSEGEPLRAKVSMEILKYIDQETQDKLKNKSSPDLSHLVTVKDGDTLPALCRKIYKNEVYCVEVARINRLTGFRHLEPGIRLLFPPLSND